MNFCLPITFVLMASLLYCTTSAQEPTSPKAPEDSLAKIDLTGLGQDELDEVESSLDEKIRYLKSLRRASFFQLRNYQSKLNELNDLQFSPEELKSRIKERRENTVDTANDNIQFMADFREYLKIVSKSDELTIYAGLPRGDKKKLQKIRDDNETIKIDGWDFYAQPVKAKPSKIEDLRSGLIDYRLFEPYSGPKFCGGFHPDFCVQWQTGTTTYNLQICFGCEEVAFITPGGRTVFDFTNTAWKKFADFALATFTRHTAGIKKMNEAFSTP